MIERPYYLTRLKRLSGVDLVKVLTGMRRAGKSGILRLLERDLLEEGAGTDGVLFLNLEREDCAHLRTCDALLEHIRQQAGDSNLTHVLIDEAQEATGIARVAYALLEDRRFDVYLSGSHARLVERELGTLMAGRFVEIPVFPLSFGEFRAAHPATSRTDTQLFRDYLANGGLPHTLMLEDDSYALHDYLDGVYHTVVRRDVALSLGKEDPTLLDAIARHLMRSLGSPVSANGISRSLLSAGRKCSDDTVALYLGALSDAYAFHRVRRFDLKANTVLKTQERFYADDLGLRTLLLGAQGASLAGLVQNVVYLELRRRYSEVYVGKHYARQICFVAQGMRGRAYFQVVPSVLDPVGLEAALAPLRAERDNYPKTLITLDELGVGSHEGIEQRNVVEWLLDVP